MPIFARASDVKHQKRLQNTLEVSAMVPILPEDSVLLSLPFGGRVLRKMGVNREEVDVLMEVRACVGGLWVGLGTGLRPHS